MTALDSQDSTNLYAILGVPDSASREQIEAAIEEQQRQWRRRQGSSRPEVREQAESQMKLLAEIEKIFLNADLREKYDASRAAEGGQQSPPELPVDAKQISAAWLRRAYAAFGQGQFEVVVECAQKAVEVTPNNVDAWQVMADAYSECDEHVWAAEALSRVLELNYSLDNLIEIARQLVIANKEHEAFDYLTKAYEIDPENEAVRTLMIMAYVGSGNPGLAYPLAKAAIEQHPEDLAIQERFVFVALLWVQSKLTEQEEGRFRATSRKQAEFGVEVLSEVLSYDIQDKELEEEAIDFYAVCYYAIQKQQRSRKRFWLTLLAAPFVFVLWLASVVVTGPLALTYGALLIYVAFRRKRYYHLAWDECSETGVVSWGDTSGQTWYHRLYDL